MARRVGAELPDDLYHRLSGRDLEASAGKAILICTLDSEGWPHPAMLSYFEVIALDRRNIRLATYGDSGTTKNMRQNGKLTISVIDKRLAYYIKGQVRELRPAMNCYPQVAKLNMQVTQVLADHANEEFEADAYVTGGVTYLNPASAEEQKRAREVLRELLE